MNERELTDKFQTTAREWFKLHVATATPFKAAEGEGLMIRWRKPNDGNYAMTFLIFTNYVVVTGDVGDAIYAFTQPITVGKLVTLDWHYFTGKCVASETGRNYEMKVAGIKHKIVNVRAIAHFIGLQMAIKQSGIL